jgi:PKD repeat protein
MDEARVGVLAPGELVPKAGLTHPHRQRPDRRRRWQRGVFLITFAVGAAVSTTCGGIGSSTSVPPPLPPSPPTAGFAFSTVSPASRVVAFTDTSTGSPTSWSWAFGDGGTSALQHPTHSYASTGPFTVTLTAGNAGGSSNATHSVTVSDKVDSQMCSGGAPTVILLVDGQLRLPLTASLNRYADDLCAEGYSVWMADAVPETPPGIRTYLAYAWDRSGRTLKGALLVGNIPHAYQWVVLHSAVPTSEEVISFQYYADLDGGFSSSPGYVGLHPFSYDVHDGDVDWEIWVGVLPMYKGSPTATIDALTRYFDRNHVYRTGGTGPPRAFLEIDELQSASTASDDAALMAALQSGLYSWTPFSNSASAQIFFNSASTGRTLQQGYAALQNGVADFTVGDSHGSYLAAGQLTIPYVEANPIRTIFFWSSGCAIGNLDHSDNFLTSVVYSPTSDVLVGKGTTNNSGGMGNNANGYYGHNVAAALAAGASFGEAMLAHVNTPLVYPWSNDWEFHFGTPVIVGDPTLRLRDQ